MDRHDKFEIREDARQAVKDLNAALHNHGDKLDYNKVIDDIYREKQKLSGDPQKLEAYMSELNKEAAQQGVFGAQQKGEKGQARILGISDGDKALLLYTTKPDTGGAEIIAIDGQGRMRLDISLQKPLKTMPEYIYIPELNELKSS